MNFSEPTWWQNALDHEDPDWKDPFELTKFGDVGNPHWWLPYEPGQPDRLLFPTIQEIIDKIRRDKEWERQSAKDNQAQALVKAVTPGQGESDTRADAIRRTEPRRSARLQARMLAIKRKNPRRSARLRMKRNAEAAS